MAMNMLPAGIRGYEMGRQAVAQDDAASMANFGQALQVGGQMMQIQDMARKRQEEDQLKELFRNSGGDLAKMRDSAFNSGMYRQGLELDKRIRDQKKEDLQLRELLGKVNEQERKQIEARTDLIGGAYAHPYTVYKSMLDKGMPKDMALEYTNQVWARVRADAMSNPLMQGASLPEVFDPDQALGILQSTKRLKDVLAPMQKDREFAQTQANAAFVVGPDGKPVANAQVQDWQMRKARAGAPVTNVSVSTEKKYGEQFAGKIADADVAMRDAAGKAPELADRANRVREILASGKVMTGAGADARLAIGKALGLAGASDAETISNTETLATSMAQNTLDAIKASGLGSGSGFSNADRDFLEKAVGGKITLEAQTINRLAELAHKAASKSAETWNKRVGDIPRSAVEGTGINTQPVQVAPLVAPAQTTFDSMPDPSKYSGKRIRADNGTVYRSDGAKWVRE